MLFWGCLICFEKDISSSLELENGVLIEQRCLESLQTEVHLTGCACFLSHVMVRHTGSNQRKFQALNASNLERSPPLSAHTAVGFQPRTYTRSSRGTTRSVTHNTLQALD